MNMNCLIVANKKIRIQMFLNNYDCNFGFTYPNEN